MPVSDSQNSWTEDQIYSGRSASTTERAPRLFPGNVLTKRGNVRAHIDNENRAYSAPAFLYSIERTASLRATRYTANNVTRVTTPWSANVARFTNREQYGKKIEYSGCIIGGSYFRRTLVILKICVYTSTSRSCGTERTWNHVEQFRSTVHCNR